MLCVVRDVLAQKHSLWEGLNPGPYSVGFKVFNERDNSRSYRPKRDYQGNPDFREHARPIQISIWYPARPAANASPLPFAAYVHLIPAERDFRKLTKEKELESERSFMAIPLARGASEAKLRSLMKMATTGFKDAPPQAGAFPLVVVGQGLGFESPITHAAMGEYLASHGYIVATSPLTGAYSSFVKLDLIDLEAEVRDMEFVISSVRALPNVDPNKLGLIGFDLGGMSALLLQMRNGDVDAVVSLDSGIAFEHNTKLLKQSPYYNPSRLRVPLLHATATREEIEASGAHEDLSLFESAVYADIYRLRFKGMRHVDFTSDYDAPTLARSEDILSEPSSDGFPEGLLDQPFYGWVRWRYYDQPVLTGFPGRL
ncbi:MAG TPA: dienelactone hydrolase family protein [Pyrinomonadaceae bacterium]|nr:dienelactone hydrolase family protein [Pyrinomonadaceae bacterium]